jgi:hypothetical protein
MTGTGSRTSCGYDPFFPEASLGMCTSLPFPAQAKNIFPACLELFYGICCKKKSRENMLIAFSISKFSFKWTQLPPAFVSSF